MALVCEISNLAFFFFSSPPTPLLFLGFLAFSYHDEDQAPSSPEKSSQQNVLILGELTCFHSTWLEHTMCTQCWYMAVDQEVSYRKVAENTKLLTTLPDVWFILAIP